MQFIIDFLVAGLMAYLAFTNSLATGITHLFDEPPLETPATNSSEDHIPATQSNDEETTGLTPLASVFSYIPDVLKQSAAYQQATIIEGIPPQKATVTDPLSAIVNIYCTFTTDKTIRTTTGTGFFVSDTGVIMTNAHVAQFLLLDDTNALGDSRCIIRNGSPATPAYIAELLYIPPAWVAEHANLIDAKNPSGTGERDYALVYVADTVSGDPLPSTFPALPLATTELSPRLGNTVVTAAGYPAGAPELDTVAGLLARSATTTISELFTFGDNKADVIALRGSALGQQGASGGPIVNADGAVVGMIATRGNDTVDGTGSLRGITIGHINRTITEETNTNLFDHLHGDVAMRSIVFSDTMVPFLTNLLTIEINTP